LAAAGINARNPLQLTVTLPPGRDHQRVLDEVTADWAAINVGVTAIDASVAAYQNAIAKGNFDLALVERISPVEAPWPLLAMLDCAARIGGYCNPAGDKLVAAAQSAPDAVQRQALLAQAQSLLFADTPVITLFVPMRWSLLAPSVTGWADNFAGRHPLAQLNLQTRPISR
jgi:peptide/nickel transport system substrate-binding protein